MAAHIAETPKLEHKGYNRGLILGLTMAESMLLLVFCLLLVAAALVTAERKKRYEAERELRVTEQKLAELKKDNFDATARVVELQARLGAGNLSPIDREKFEKEWRELISARHAVDRLHRSGVEMTELEKLAALRKVLIDNGIDLDAAPRDQKACHRQRGGEKPARVAAHHQSQRSWRLLFQVGQRRADKRISADTQHVHI